MRKNVLTYGVVIPCVLIGIVLGGGYLLLDLTFERPTDEQSQEISVGKSESLESSEPQTNVQSSINAEAKADDKGQSDSLDIAGASIVDQGDRDTQLDSNTVGTNSSSHNSVVGLIIAIVCLTLVAVLAICIALWLYLWRKRIEATPGGRRLIVPETWESVSDEHNKKLDDQTKEVGELATVTASAISDLVQHNLDLQKQIESVAEGYATLQNHLDTQDAEIARLKSGYDAAIFRRFLNRFIRVHTPMQEALNESSIDVQEFEQIKELLEDALEECGLKPLVPTIGEHYSQARGVADHPKLVANDDPERTGTICEILEHGYQLEENGEVIRTAKVSVYDNL